tara:strand:- start:49834 stop:50721 length:888 start_codon:yes stop_codon:yes gene_type:complete
MSPARKSLQQHATILNTLREFFNAREVLEVSTPIISPYAVTDVFLESIAVPHYGYLQTSPEYAMKKLLADGSGDIFQLCKCFRADECGRLHKPEFTMLEWYRVGFDHHQLMDEMDGLLQTVLHCGVAQRLTYQQVFQHMLSLDPLVATADDLNATCKQQQIDLVGVENDKDDLLNVLFSHCIEPQLQQPTFIYDYPASQAALAKLNPDDSRVAQRFEVFVKGIELANGFHELTDAKEQLQRFEQDNQLRKQKSLPQRDIDSDFLAALEKGLPNCAGVALGVDRLIMLASNKTSII